METYTVY